VPAAAEALVVRRIAVGLGARTEAGKQAIEDKDVRARGGEQNHGGHYQDGAARIQAGIIS